MDRSIAKAAKEAEDVSAGLQVFLDHIPQQDAGIFESIRELLSLAQGLLDLRISAARQGRVPAPLQADIQALLRSISLTLVRVRKMFGETRFVKVSGERPYFQAWYDLGVEFRETEGGPPLWIRLELYSVFLKEMLASLKGGYVEPKSVARHRLRITTLLNAQQSTSSGFNNTPFVPPLRPPSAPYAGYPPMAGGPFSDDWDNTPFPAAPEPPRAFVATSPTMSSASYHTHASSQSSGSAANGAPHWATQVFNGRHGSTRFPSSLRERSICYGRPLPRALERLAAEGFHLVSRLNFEADDIEARFYLRPEFGRARILICSRDQSGNPLTFCIPLTALKLVRNKASIELNRMDRDHGTYQLWASLNFVDHERLVLFYSTFAALKHADQIPPAEGLHTDYFQTQRKEEEQKFGGQTIYLANSIHALRVFYDKYAKGIRLEARPFRGPMKHVPIWTAFVTLLVEEKHWARRVNTRQVELRRVEQHVFAEAYVPTRGRNGRFYVDFKEREDADAFIRVLWELATAK